MRSTVGPGGQAAALLPGTVRACDLCVFVCSPRFLKVQQDWIDRQTADDMLQRRVRPAFVQSGKTDLSTFPSLFT